MHLESLGRFIDNLLGDARLRARVQAELDPLLLREDEMPEDPPSSEPPLSAAMMLAELYQHADQPQRAIELLESLGSVTGQSVFALSLAELYAHAHRPRDVLRVSEGFTSNEDYLTAQLLVFRAGALVDEGVNDSALASLKEAMRFRSRDAAILRQARYLRAMISEKAGRKAQLKRDLERSTPKILISWMWRSDSACKGELPRPHVPRDGWHRSYDAEDANWQYPAGRMSPSGLEIESSNISLLISRFRYEMLSNREDAPHGQNQGFP